MKKILFVINNLGCNGAPVYALNVCKILMKKGYQCDIWSMKDGLLYEKFVENLINIKVIKFYDYIDELEGMIEQYDCAILFTIQTYLFYEYCRNIVPTMWYIHEGRNIDRYLENKKCKEIFLRAKNLFVVSEYAQEHIWNSYRKKTKVIHNFVFDKLLDYNDNQKICDGKKRFLIIGSMIERKGYDIMFDAYFLLPNYVRNKCEIYFCGEQCKSDAYVKNILSKINNESCIHNFNILTEDDGLYDLYKRCDVVIVPSRDESCSLVTLEAAMMGKPIVVSQNVGAKYIVSDQNGWVLKENVPFELAFLLEQIINNKYDLVKMGAYSREKYLQMATSEEYEKRINEVVKSLLLHNNLLWIISHKIIWWIEKNYFHYFRSPLFNKDIKHGSRIILYGAGEYGKKWRCIFEHSKYYKLVGWVDKYVCNCNNEILGIDMIKYIDYDYILISIVSESIVNEIIEELTEMGISKEKLIFGKDNL